MSSSMMLVEGLKRELKAHGITYAELARRIGMSEASVKRMFARRSPEKAEIFREALRNAKDRNTMLAVSREMIEEIEKVAGHERADSISERLAMLLPVNAVAH